MISEHCVNNRHTWPSVGDVLPSEFRAGLEQLAAARPDRAVALPWEIGDEAAARRAYARLVPEPGTRRLTRERPES